MTMFNRLAAALAACCIIATTLAFPTSPFGTTLPLTAKDTANIPLPTSCTVQENDTFDNYGITVPVAYSADQCTKARDALSDLTTGFEDAWVCESYGDWTILIFSAEKGAAKQVDEAIATAFAQFTFQCANSNAAGSTLVKKGEPIDFGAQSCTATAHGAYNTYHVHIGVPYDANRCVLFKVDHLEVKESIGVRDIDYHDDGYGHTAFKFFANVNHGESINSVFEENFTEINGFNYPDD